ncbi:hypothetical protein PINS_up020466, partial [Pythium insidiosum]
MSCRAPRVRRKGGAFIATVDGKWVHMACSMFLPELYVQSSPNGEIIGGLHGLKFVFMEDK